MDSRGSIGYQRHDVRGHSAAGLGCPPRWPERHPKNNHRPACSLRNLSVQKGIINIKGLQL